MKLLLSLLIFIGSAANAQNLSLLPSIPGISVLASNHLIPENPRGAYGSQLIFSIKNPKYENRVYEFYKNALKHWRFCGLEREKVFLWFNEEKQMSAFVFTKDSGSNLVGEFSSYVYKSNKHYDREKNLACNRGVLDAQG